MFVHELRNLTNPDMLVTQGQRWRGVSEEMVKQPEISQGKLVVYQRKWTRGRSWQSYTWTIPKTKVSWVQFGSRPLASPRFANTIGAFWFLPAAFDFPGLAGKTSSPGFRMGSTLSLSTLPLGVAFTLFQRTHHWNFDGRYGYNAYFLPDSGVITRSRRANHRW